MAFWRWREVHCGRDTKSYEQALKLLAEAGVPTKQRLIGGHNLMGVHTGKAIRNIQYYIYVKKEDAEMAMFLLRR